MKTVLINVILFVAVVILISLIIGDKVLSLLVAGV